MHWLTLWWPDCCQDWENCRWPRSHWCSRPPRGSSWIWRWWRGSSEPWSATGTGRRPDIYWGGQETQSSFLWRLPQDCRNISLEEFRSPVWDVSYLSYSLQILCKHMIDILKWCRMTANNVNFARPQNHLKSWCSLMRMLLKRPCFEVCCCDQVSKNIERGNAWDGGRRAFHSEWQESARQPGWKITAQRWLIWDTLYSLDLGSLAIRGSVSAEIAREREREKIMHSVLFLSSFLSFCTRLSDTLFLQLFILTLTVIPAFTNTSFSL